MSEKFDKDDIDRMFEEAQAKLPPEDRIADAAYRHGICGGRSYDGFVCTKVRGHQGDHMAHNRRGEVAKRWKQ